MGVIEETLAANQKYAETFEHGHLPMPPARKLAVLACMDARLTVEQVCGLKTGDAHIIRNAGGLITEDALRSLVISHHLLGTREVLIINHTDCGMLTFRDEDLRERLRKETGAAPETPRRFYAFSDIEENLRRQIQAAREHSWIPAGITIRGFVYDVRTGSLREVEATFSAATGGAADEFSY